MFIWYGNFIGLNTTNVAKEFGSIYNNLLLNKNDYNESYVNHSLEKYKEYFDTHFKNPLTEEQRRAIISGSGEHQKIGVEFDGGLRKKFIVKYVKLKKL